MKSQNYFPALRSWLGACCLMLVCAVAGAQSVTGTVTDSGGEPLVGASVKNMSQAGIGAATDINGTFSLKAVKGDVISVSYTGFSTKQIAVGAESRLAIILEPNNDVLDELVVVGYGVQKKSDLTGAVASVKGEELTRQGTVDILQALQGRSSGVEITSQSGRPGAGSRIRIRGVGTINNSEPLYVVDGFQTGDISFINPGDIESMEVLKDASATAIYGSRGANGVVIITTKRGKEGKTQFEFSTYAGSQQVWRELDFMGATEYAKNMLTAYELDGIYIDREGPIYTRLKYAADGNYRGTDWQDIAFRTGMIQNYTLSVNGGSNGNRFNVSGGYFKQEGTVRNTDLTKYFLRLGNDLTLTKWLRAGFNAAYAYDGGQFFDVNYYGAVLPELLKIDPVTQAWDPVAGNWLRADISGAGNVGRILEETKNLNQTNHNIVTNIYAEADLTKSLRFRTQVGVNFKNGFNKSYYPEFFIEPEEQRDVSLLQEYRGQNIGWMWTNYLTWNKQVGKHQITAMLGQEAQENRFRGATIQAFDVPADEDLQYISSAKNVDFLVTSGQSDEALLSFFGRLNYNYDNRYLVTATVRRDGSSRFLDATRWGVFPSFSLGWNLGEEAFLQDNNLISTLKIRGGWGQVGNQNSAPNYGYVTTVAGNNYYVFNNTAVQGFIPNRLSNPELRWETTQMTNIGFDAGLWNDRVLLTFDWFDKQTKDMIVEVPVPRFVGANPPRANAGDMSNKGIELSLTYRNYDRPLRYELGVNYTRITNQVVSIGGGSPIDAGGVAVSGNATRTEPGYELAYFYGYKTDGIFNDQAEIDAYVNSNGTPVQGDARLGEIKYVDVNGDGKIDGTDRTYLGSATPDFTFGINGMLGYKGFDFRFFLYGVQGNEIFNGFSPIFSSTRNVAGRWTPETPENNLLRPTTRTGNNVLLSDLFVEDGSYLRLRNIQLGYTLPGKLTSKLHVRNLRLYAAADNLWTKTSYTGWDPEVGEYFYNPLGYGLDVGTYPMPKSLRFGLDMKF